MSVKSDSVEAHALFSQIVDLNNQAIETDDQIGYIVSLLASLQQDVNRLLVCARLSLHNVPDVSLFPVGSAVITAPPARSSSTPGKLIPFAGR
jgi:hypothetical protein